MKKDIDIVLKKGDKQKILDLFDIDGFYGIEKNVDKFRFLLIFEPVIEILIFQRDSKNIPITLDLIKNSLYLQNLKALYSINYIPDALKNALYIYLHALPGVPKEQDILSHININHPRYENTETYHDFIVMPIPVLIEKILK